MGYQSGDARQGWGNNINESPKWNSSFIDYFLILGSSDTKND